MAHPRLISIRATVPAGPSSVTSRAARPTGSRIALFRPAAHPAVGGVHA
ncbi:MAG TPA: hypothetical protein VMH35_28610 [Streptosporangiaceae bacterium]|nr:hypothetical protein [Streptosporangiaceae bacterium]